MFYNIDSMLEVSLFSPDDFLKIRETLTRIGVATDHTLYQSCHILHKQGRFFIVHFKEMFLLDGKSANLSENDLCRRNTIAFLLQEWGLLEIIEPENFFDDRIPLTNIKIVPYREKQNWQLVPKYTIGRKKS